MGKGKKSRGSGYNGNTADIITVRGHSVMPLVTEADPSGAQRFILHPTAIDVYRLADLCAIYQQYTFRKLRVSFCRGDGASSALAAFTPCVSASAAVNSIALSAIDQMTIAFPGQTTPATLRIPRVPLHGEKDWYDCGDANSGPGEFWFANLSETGVGIGGTGLVRFDYEISFNGRTPTAVTSHAWLARPIHADSGDSDSSTETVTVRTTRKKAPPLKNIGTPSK